MHTACHSNSILVIHPLAFSAIRRPRLDLSVSLSYHKPRTGEGSCYLDSPRMESSSSAIAPMLHRCSFGGFMSHSLFASSPQPGHLRHHVVHLIPCQWVSKPCRRTKVRARKHDLAQRPVSSSCSERRIPSSASVSPPYRRRLVSTVSAVLFHHSSRSSVSRYRQP